MTVNDACYTNTIGISYWVLLVFLLASACASLGSRKAFEASLRGRFNRSASADGNRPGQTNTWANLNEAKIPGSGKSQIVRHQPPSLSSNQQLPAPLQLL